MDLPQIVDYDYVPPNPFQANVSLCTWLNSKDFFGGSILDEILFIISGIIWVYVRTMRRKTNVTISTYKYYWCCIIYEYINFNVDMSRPTSCILRKFDSLEFRVVCLLRIYLFNLISVMLKE